MLPKVHPNFVLAIEAINILNNDIDYSKCIDNSSHYCKSCYDMIVEIKISKFGSANCINVLPYQKYPYILSDLIPIKEIFIAYTYLVISVIMLKPSKTGSTTLYHWI